MSHYATGLVTEHRPYRGSKLMVALQLAEFSNTQGLVNETIETMAERATLSARQFRRILREMEADGWIECLRRSAGGSGVGSQYRISADWLRLPVGWRPGQGSVAHDEITRTEPGQKPGQNPDILTGFPAEKPGHPDRVFFEPLSSLKTLPPVVPQFELQPDTGNGGTDDLETADLKAAQWMLERLRTLNPGHRAPRTWDRWVRDIRLLREEVQGLTHRRICEVFRWANEDRTPRPGSNFCWARQILSPGNLRTQWDRLTVQCDEAPQAKAVSPQCQDCGVRPWSIAEQGKPRRCRECADKAERRAA